MSPSTTTNIAGIAVTAALCAGCAGPSHPTIPPEPPVASSEHYSLHNSRVIPTYLNTTGEQVTLNTDEAQEVILNPRSSFDPNGLVEHVRHLVEEENVFSNDTKFGNMYRISVTDQFGYYYNINIYLHLESEEPENGERSSIQLLSFDASRQDLEQTIENPAEISILLQFSGRGVSSPNVYKTGVIIDQLISLIQLFNNRPVYKSEIPRIISQVLAYYDTYHPGIFSGYAYYQLCAMFSSSQKIPAEYLELYNLWYETWDGKEYNPELYPDDYEKWLEFLEDFALPDTIYSQQRLNPALSISALTKLGYFDDTLHKHLFDQYSQIQTGPMSKGDVSI